MVRKTTAPTLEFHPIASIFPLMEGTEFELLVEDVRDNGLRESIWLYEGKVLDGRNRVRACAKAGVTVPTRQFTGSLPEALAFVWSENVTRRHLDSGQIAGAEAKREKLHTAYAAQVQRMKDEATAKQRRGTDSTGKAGGRGKKKNLGGLVSEGLGDWPCHHCGGSHPVGGPNPCHDPELRRTLTARARAVGTNRRYLEAAKRFLEEAPDRLEEVMSGKKKMSQVIREVNHEARRAKIAALPKGRFRVIYADPPWSYGSGGAGIDQYGPAQRHYPAMTIAELCAMDVRNIAHDDAVLFLWVTSPMLAECWPVIKAWGFIYKASFVWDKVKHNYGHYNSVRHEFLLVCTRGTCTPDTKKLYDSVLTEERSEAHSEKPECIRTMIDTLYTTGSRLELFARKAAKGWKAYGTDV